jgi:MOSC domain-containing protein YiiM
MMGEVASVSYSDQRGLRKTPRTSAELIAGLGVRGDVHSGERIRHLARMRKDPTQPNLRQVHLINAEFVDELRDRGFDVTPGAMGENVLVRGLDLLILGTGTVLALGADARIELTGLRNPCKALEEIGPGMMQATLDHAPYGALIRRAGVMGVVLRGGIVCVADPVDIVSEARTFVSLQPV